MKQKTCIFLPDNQITYILDAIIGNDASKARRGLIQISVELRRLDLAYKFMAYTKTLLEKAEIPLFFIRGYFVDIIKYFNLKENKTCLKQLREKDDVQSFKYHKTN